MGKMKEYREQLFETGCPLPGTKEDARLEREYRAWRAKTKLFPCVTCGRKNVSPDPKPMCPVCHEEMNAQCDKWAEEDRRYMEENIK